MWPGAKHGSAARSIDGEGGDFLGGREGRDLGGAVDAAQRVCAERLLGTLNPLPNLARLEPCAIGSVMPWPFSQDPVPRTDTCHRRNPGDAPRSHAMP